MSDVRTVEEWFAVWPDCAAGLRLRSAETIAHTAVMAAPFERKFGRRVLATLAKHECAAWAAQARNASYVRFAKTVMADAVLAGVVAESPLAGVALPKRRPGRGEYIPDAAEVMALAEAGARFGMRELILVAADSGLRLGELAALEVRDLSPGANGTLMAHVRKGKGDKSRDVVIRRPGADELRPAMHRFAGGWKVLLRPGDLEWDRKSVSRGFVKARATVGLPMACTFHALRKHHATVLLDAGVTDIDVAVQLGHFDARGNPDPGLVRRVYGRPNHALALARIASLA